MEPKIAGRQSFRFTNHPSIVSSSAIVGQKEGSGPLAGCFDHVGNDPKFGQATWEKAESRMQELALGAALNKASLQNKDIGILFAGDLLNQCIGSSFSLRDTDIPFAGLYGACSTMAEGLILAAMAVDGGYTKTAAAMTSSHFASAERQYRFPLVYGGQRTPTAQWTVTGAGCALLSRKDTGLYLNAATIGSIADYGIQDANNMGAAMAPAAYATMQSHFRELSLSPGDYDMIFTGDLGRIGKQIVLDFFRQDGVDLQWNYDDCGCMIYDPKKQDVHAGGSGCGCGAVTLCGYILPKLRRGEWKHILFCGTGALLSPVSSQQGESVPGVCHAVAIGTERR